MESTTYTYTLAFIKYQQDILMLNRIKPPWLGLWNGLGGKIQANESPMASIIRELEEEMGITFSPLDIMDKGVLTWNDFEANGQGIHMFVIELKKPLSQTFPRMTDEGILDLKSFEWIMDEMNYGVAPNIPYFLPVLFESGRHHIHCIFENDTLKEVEISPL